MEHIDSTPYHYTECGLDNVRVYGLTPVIDNDGDEVVTIRNINCLHKVIAQAIITRPAMMSGKEFRFLRTEMGLTQAELAKILHKEPITVGRWERGETDIDANAETLVRLLCREKLNLETNEKIEAMTGYSVQSSVRPPIEIEKDMIGEYRPLAA